MAVSAGDESTSTISGCFLAFVCLGVVIGNVGQLMGLDCLLTSLGSNAGPYFVLWFCSFFFNLFFWPVVYYRWKAGIITKQMINVTFTSRIHILLVAIGISDALNGLLVVYASNPSRVP